MSSTQVISKRKLRETADHVGVSATYAFLLNGYSADFKTDIPVVKQVLVDRLPVRTRVLSGVVVFHRSVCGRITRL